MLDMYVVHKTEVCKTAAHVQRCIYSRERERESVCVFFLSLHSNFRALCYKSQ